MHSMRLKYLNSCYSIYTFCRLLSGFHFESHSDPPPTPTPVAKCMHLKCQVEWDFLYDFLQFLRTLSQRKKKRKIILSGLHRKKEKHRTPNILLHPSEKGKDGLAELKAVRRFSVVDLSCSSRKLGSWLVGWRGGGWRDGAWVAKAKDQVLNALDENLK